ncbi:MAG: efflux RND transporter periplasmic adaptor subunit [bacterium]
MKFKTKHIIWSIVFAIVILLLGKKIFFNSGGESDTPQNPGSKKISVNAIIIKPQELQNRIFSNGTLVSNEEVEIRSEITGKIIHIFFEEGRRVKKNDLLVKINDADLQATLKKNKAKETLAHEQEFRYKQLLEKSLTSQQEYEGALSELNVVLADIEFTEVQIAKTEIRAPFDGIVGLRSVSVGSYISPQTKIATLQNTNPIKVDFSVPQKYFGLVKEGKQITVRLPSGKKDFSGRIYAVEPKIDLITRSVQARALIPNNNGELTPGAYAEIDIILEELNKAILVPTDAIVPDINGEKVFVYKSGKAVPQYIKPGIRDENNIQIISGLNSGDTLIVSGIIQLRSNSPVILNSIN